MKPSHASTSKERNAARQTHEGWASEQEIPTWPSCSFKSPITVTWFMNQVEKMKDERAIRFIRKEVTYSLSVESISFIHESSLKGNDRELRTQAEKSNISNCRWVWNFLNVLSYFPASKWTITNIFHCVSEIIQRALSVVTMTTVCVVSHTHTQTLCPRSWGEVCDSFLIRFCRGFKMNLNFLNFLWVSVDELQLLIRLI